MFPTLDQFFRSYTPYEIIVELAIIWGCVYLAMRFLRGTRGAGIIKGFLLLLVIMTLFIRVISGTSDAFARLDFLYRQFLGLAAILLIVVFQPELRQAMIRIGQTGLFRPSTSRLNTVINSVVEAVEFLSKSQFGALIAIEREVGLRGLIEGGVRLDSEISPQLLESIFWPNSPLHDLGVVVRNDRVIAASVQFPLVEEGILPHDLGSRHRAGVGLTLESDCVVVIVSEETGAISIARHGRLMRDIPRDAFRQVLEETLYRPATEGSKSRLQALWSRLRVPQPETIAAPRRTALDDPVDDSDTSATDDDGAGPKSASGGGGSRADASGQRDRKGESKESSHARTK